MFTPQKTLATVLPPIVLGTPPKPVAASSRRAVLATAASAFLGSACSLHTDEDHVGEDAPRTAALARTPRVAWVLSSGGPRGFAHIGVLKALADMGLRPDVIVGASAGALVGTLFAAGMSAKGMEALALDLPAWRFARLNVGSGERLSGSGIASFVQGSLMELGASAQLQNLPLPVVCAAQRLSDGEVFGLTHGDAGLAVQAACAIEGQFAPVRIRGQRFADADHRVPLPVRLARSLGATRVMAVDVSAFEDRAPASAERFRAGDLKKRALTQPDALVSDLVLRPDFGYYVNVSREFRERAMLAGYRSALAEAVRLKTLHTT